MPLNVLDQTRKCRRCGAYVTAKQDGGEHHVAGRAHNALWTKRLCWECHREITDNPDEFNKFRDQYSQEDWDTVFPEFF